MAQDSRIGQAIQVQGTAAGTTVIRPRACELLRIILPSNQTGTATFYDTAIAGGTAASNYVLAVAQTAGSIPSGFEVGAAVSKGLTVVVGGTVNFSVIVS